MGDRADLIVSPEMVGLPKRKHSEDNTSDQPDPIKGGDVYGWAMTQAELICARRFDEIDWINVADEIESVAKSEVRALTSNLIVLLTHMLRWEHQPQKRSRSWSLSIDEHRARAEDEFADNPSMKLKVVEILPRAYRSARAQASGETDLPLKTFPTLRLGRNHEQPIRV